MYELPLFPLNTVLFPGMPLALHIFEDRYKLMIGRCIQERRPFGVVLIKKGIEALGSLPEPYTIGCTAYIRQVERLEEGRMNIGAVGHRRFRVLSLDYHLPYLVGQVESFPLESVLPESQEIAAQSAAARKLRPLVTRYLETLSSIDGVEITTLQLPGEPVRLAYVAATILQVPEEQKQPLLAADGALNLLLYLRHLYRREISVLRMMLEVPEAELGSFSLN